MKLFLATAALLYSGAAAVPMTQDAEPKGYLLYVASESEDEVAPPSLHAR